MPAQTTKYETKPKPSPERQISRGTRQRRLMRLKYHRKYLPKFVMRMQLLEHQREQSLKRLTGRALMRARERKRKALEDGGSPPRESQPLLSLCAGAAEKPALGWEDVHQMVGEVADSRGHVFGYPMFSDGVPLVLSERFPYPEMANLGRETMEEIKTVAEAESEGGEYSMEDLPHTMANDWQIVNRWISNGHEIVVCRKPDGRAVKFKRDLRMFQRLLKVSMIAHTIGSCKTHVIAAEAKALEKLEGLIGPGRFNQYVHCGMFLETSTRSNLVYIFRRARPTLVLSTYSGYAEPLVALCLHPIGHYERTFLGVMVPTDDVIAHLLMMRGDEHGYWRKANQHPLHEPEADF